MIGLIAGSIVIGIVIGLITLLGGYLISVFIEWVMS